jgi:hypothetical protein
MLYEFIALPNDPAAGTPGLADDRISINGVTITSAATAVDLSVPASAELDFANVQHSSAPVGVGASPESASTLDYTFGPSPYHPDYVGPVTALTGQDVVDITTMTVSVQNLQGNDASKEFLVYTVNDAPDALIPAIAGAPVPQDLSAWTYVGTGAGATSLGPLFSGDTEVAGTYQPDSPSDSSVSDLRVAIGTTAGDSFVNWYSPFGTIPFAQDGTYRIEWTVTRGAGFPSALATPNTRFRHSNDLFGTTSSGLVNAVSYVAGAFTDGRTYSQFFDQLDLASATGTISFGGNDAAENGAQLLFETVDLTADPGAASNAFLELDAVEITNINRAALVASGTLENQITDWTNTSQASTAGLGVNFGNQTNIAVVPAVAQVTMAAPISTSGNCITADGFGNSPIIQVAGIGFVPFNVGLTANAFYRAEWAIDFSGSTGTNAMSRVRLGVSTGTFQTEYDIDSRLNALGGANRRNPGLDGGTFACYLALPEGADLAPGDTFNANDFTWMGDGTINASIRVVDLNDTLGGTVTVSSMTFSSFPESLLP